jgi:hypothetical protein
LKFAPFNKREFHNFRPDPDTTGSVTNFTITGLTLTQILLFYEKKPSKMFFKINAIN